MRFTEPGYAQELDSHDILAHFRQHFVFDDPYMIYLDGNSLGRMPKTTPKHIENLLYKQWSQRLIRGWNEGWITAQQRLGDKLAPLIGAQPGEVIISESTSTNLFKLAAAAVKAKPGRRKIISDVFNFPSDIYIFQGLIDMLGIDYKLELINSRDGITIDIDDILTKIDEDTALVSLSHVAYKSAYLYDMARITRYAHKQGALTLWDLSHSAGSVPVHLSENQVDLAVGCTYKYLNGGPGAPAFLFVRKELQDQLLQPIWGWFAQKDQFDFTLDFEPAPDLHRFLVGTPPLISTLAIEPGLDLMLDAGIEALRTKSINQTEYLISLSDAWLSQYGVQLGTPREPGLRGSHVSLRHAEGYRICRALIDPIEPAVKVIPDFRAPDFIRLGIAPIYTTYTEIFRAMERLTNIMETQAYKQYSPQREIVT